MKQPHLPTFSRPILGIRRLRRAIGGEHRLKALNKRKWEDGLDIILGCVLVTALEAKDTPIKAG